MKNVIVTGANGFIGSNVIRELIRQDVNVYAIVRNDNDRNIKNLKNISIFSCDLDKISSLGEILPKNINYDTFYHFAWMGSAGEERANTILQLNNVQWTIDALRIAKNLGCKRFVCSGSIVEHETIATSYKQGNKPGLGYIYGGGKVVARIMCMSVASNIGIDLIWTEITNAYGEGELSPRLVNTTIRKVINGESPQFTSGTQNYDFVHIEDVSRAFYLIGKNGKPFNSYIIGSSNAKSLKEFFIEMKEAISPDLDFVFGDIPFTGTDLPIEKFDCSKTEKDTGFRANISFGEGVKRTMEWLKKQEV